MNQSVFKLSNKQYNRSDFIKSKSNNTACEVIENWPNECWGVNPYIKSLILRGPLSSGKTFLAKNWAKVSGSKAVDINKAHDQEMINSYSGFIIEDIDHITNENHLLHYFNSINECGKYLLLTCSNIPKFVLPDLNSRIQSINIIDICYPDDDLLRILIFKFFSGCAVRVDNNVISYLLQHLPRRFDFIQKTLDKINKASLENQHKITIPFIKKILQP